MTAICKNRGPLTPPKMPGEEAATNKARGNVVAYVRVSLHSGQWELQKQQGEHVQYSSISRQGRHQGGTWLTRGLTKGPACGPPSSSARFHLYARHTYS